MQLVLVLLSILLLACGLVNDEKQNQGTCFVCVHCFFFFVNGCVNALVRFLCFRMSRNASWLDDLISNVNWILGLIEFQL